MANETDLPPLGPGLIGPSPHQVAVTPSDVADLAAPCRAIWVGGAGNLRIASLRSSTAVTFYGVQAGSLLPIYATRIYSTGTTATYIVAIY